MLSYRVHGKWILAGEHSVLRGCPALVFPVRSRYLDMTYERSSHPLKVSLVNSSPDLEMAFWGVLEKALQQVSRQRSDLSGKVIIQSTVPVGAGMGASATLCVALAHWFVDLNFLSKDQSFAFAKELEDLFHGQSSGVDVAVALHNRPLLFSRPNTLLPFQTLWQPHFFLSYCGRRGITADCVRKVQTLLKAHPELGEGLDIRMRTAVDLAARALQEKESLEDLKRSLQMAGTCFYEWGLVSRELGEHMGALQETGALAVKPTGSGEGGFVLSLWETRPDPEIIARLGLIEA